MGHQVLLVEDDPDARYIYATCLEHAGFDVVATSSARAATDAVHERLPEIVVLDRRLPDRDGLELAKQWRAAAGAMARVPIIALTAFASRPDVEAALIAGCDAFLAKPCPGSVLVAHVTKLLVQCAPTRKMAKLPP